jgi:hypothetical protein
MKTAACVLAQRAGGFTPAVYEDGRPLAFAKTPAAPGGETRGAA